MTTHNVSKAKHRPRSNTHSKRERLRLAQIASLRQRPKAPITLAKNPWDMTDDNQQTETPRLRTSKADAPE